VTVRELIAELEKHPLDMLVFVYDSEWNDYGVPKVTRTYDRPLDSELIEFVEVYL
jgi:hypothetical protein